ncbi:UNVERIFIED_CONTAM: CRISPR-associated Cmr4 family protein [Acetivibrio alkalicellulosi]
MRSYLYRIDCITNLHVGSGDVSYNIIDNEVERDPVLGTPTIYSSGIKGSLREHFENIWGKDDQRIIDIFGSDAGKSTNKESKNDLKENNSSNSKSVAGKYKFFNANICSRPLRVSEGSVSYANVTTIEIINNLLSLLHDLNIKFIDEYSLPLSVKLDIPEDSFIVNNIDINSIEGLPVVLLEDVEIKELLDIIIGGNYAITAKETLEKFELPVNARNYLVNGISENLWYEEFVPHKSVFYFVILNHNEILSDFNEVLENNIVQIGGNASIGYGYTKLKRIAQSKEV